MTVGRVDATDMYRAALVQATSALDHYFHGVVIDRATDLMLGRLDVAGAAGRVGLSFAAVREIVNAQTLVDRELIARKHAAERLRRETLQHPESIAAALALVGVPRVWSVVFGAEATNTTTALGTIITRRNRIVHESDADPLSPGASTPLSDADALEAIETVHRVITAIDPLC